MNRKAVFAYGRFNPPTVGHQMMINKVINMARRNGAKPFVVVTHTQNSKRNPLSQNEKINILQTRYPNVEFLRTSRKEPTPGMMVNTLRKMGYNSLTLVVGSNRVNSFSKIPELKNVRVVSAGNRNASAPGIAGMSATKVRAMAMNLDLKKFRECLMAGDSVNVCKYMYLIRNRLLTPPPTKRKRS